MSEYHRDIGGILTPEVKASPLMRQLQVQPESADEIESIEVDPGSMRQLPTGRPQQIPVQPNRGPSYVPEAPRYGPVVPRSAPGTGNVMVQGVAPSTGHATQAAYQPARTTRHSGAIGTMRPALPTIDQVRSGDATIRRSNPTPRPVTPRPTPRADARPPTVASAPARTYMRVPDDILDARATRPIVKISTQPSQRQTSDADTTPEPSRTSRRDTHR